MSRFVLHLLPDNRAVLTTEEELTQREAHEVREAWTHWQDSGGIAIVADCRVQRIDSIDLVLRDGDLRAVG